MNVDDEQPVPSGEIPEQLPVVGADEVAAPEITPGPPPPVTDPSVEQTAATVPVVQKPWFLPTIVGGGALVVGLLLGGMIGSTAATASFEAEAQAAAEAEESAAKEAEAAKLKIFSDAVKKCSVSGKVVVTDGGHSMIIDAAGEEFGSGDVDFGELDCIISAVDTPASVRSKMYETRSLDGRQEGAWGDLTASWSYHPDDGLDIIFELQE
ncbi:hypothetical protein ACFVTX_08080 [Agromyces sp. NPDC058136]|uniref:hypothetical protein n=1 Tax=Agromyces sp. NPDC058136 TaxID=3346354 RepID=UPI0036DCAEC5